MKHLFKQWFLALPIEGKRCISGWNIQTQEDEDRAYFDWLGLTSYEMQAVYEYYHDEYYEVTKHVSFWIDEYDYYIDKYAS